MKLIVLNGAGETQTIIVNGVAEPVDRSGAIEALGEAQEVMAANDERGGWRFQNLSEFAMWLNEIDEASATGSFLVRAGESFPPPNYPVTLGAVSVMCEATAETDPATLKYTAREW